MQKIMYVEGMMCAHCEARVRKALEALPFVEKAEPDHSAGRVTVTLSAPGSDGELTENVILIEPRARYFPAVRQKDCFDERQPPAHSAEHRSARHSTAEYHFSALRQAVPIRSDAPVIISMREKHQQIERIVYAARRQFFYTFVAEAFYIP